VNRTALDGDRLLRRLDELAHIGGVPGGGVTRLAYSPADVAARDLVASWMRQAGLEVIVDPACNLIGRSAPFDASQPAVVLGSHLDTVEAGGHLDGAYGVVAAIEVAAGLVAARSCETVPLVVVAFANEEGARGSLPFDGSRAVVGRPNPLDSTDRDGRTLAERISAAGGNPHALTEAAWPVGSVRSYLELHIEQGPVLEHQNVPIGVVAAITGRRNLDLTVHGAANHAGTTPMGLRRDALVAAAQIVLAVESVAAEQIIRVATTGALEVRPGVRNVVPGRVDLQADLRDVDDARLDAAVVRLRADIATIAASCEVEVICSEQAAVPAAPTDAALCDLIEAAAAAGGSASMRLPSGAGHDAQTMATVSPIGMIFVPSRDGISHSPLEHSSPTHLLAGADVLDRTVRHLLSTPPSPDRIEADPDGNRTDLCPDR